MKRRTFLKNVAFGMGALATPGLFRSASASGGISIGASHSLSGLYSTVGTDIALGAQWGAEVYSAELGTALNLVALDDQSDPGRAVRRVQEALAQGTRHFVGGTTSPIGLAVSKEIYGSRGVFVTGASTDEVTGVDCNRSTFRWPAPSFSAVNITLREFHRAFPESKRFYTITGQYVFGEALLRGAEAIFDDLGLEHVGNSFHSVSEREFSGYIATARAAEPDVLVILNFGPQVADVIRQAAAFGMKRNTKILVVWSSGLDEFRALGSETIEDVYFGVNYWHTAATPGNQRFVDFVRGKTGATPSYLHAVGYANVQILAEGLKKVGDPNDIPALAAAMEGMEYDGLTDREVIRAEDHQALKAYFLLKGKPADQMGDPDDFADIVAQGKFFIEPEASGCTLTEFP